MNRNKALLGDQGRARVRVEGEEEEKGRRKKDVGSEQARENPSITSTGVLPNWKSHPGPCSLFSSGLLAAHPPAPQEWLVYKEDMKR